MNLGQFLSLFHHIHECNKFTDSQSSTNLDILKLISWGTAIHHSVYQLNRQTCGTKQSTKHCRIKQLTHGAIHQFVAVVQHMQLVKREDLAFCFSLLLGELTMVLLFEFDSGSFNGDHIPASPFVSKL